MMDRRGFLRMAGLGVAAGTAACGCDRPGTQGRAPTTRTAAAGSPAAGLSTGSALPPVSPAPSAVSSAAPRPPDWDALARGLHGSLVRPGDAGYDSVRLLYNTRFDRIRPQALARCANADDVRECVNFARRYGVRLALRSGGHSYAGWSTGTGLVVDVGPMDTVRLHGDRAEIGAGTRLVDLYAGLSRSGVGVPAGSCPTVGVAGLTLGGGIGVLTRAWGLTCDNLIAAQVVTADGRVRICDARREPDLYWALRGGGGGNFGVVTSLSLRTRPAGSLAMVFLSWPWRHAADVVRGWQTWLPGMPDALWSNVHLLTGASGAPSVTANAFYLGDSGEAERLVDRLVAAVGSEPSSRSAARQPYLAAMLRLAGCADRTVAQCHLPSQNPRGTLRRETYAAKSHVLGAPLTASGIATLVAGVERLSHRPDAGSGGVLFDALGGAVARVAPDATAFPHRGAVALAQYIVNWSATAPQSVVDGSLAWLREYRASMGRYVSGGGAYVNYIDPDLPDWGRAYYGANLARLRRVKAAYDPDALFTFPQAVRPA